jgi:hypothetical protein
MGGGERSGANRLILRKFASPNKFATDAPVGTAGGRYMTCR